MEEIRVGVDCSKPTKPFKHFYEAVGYANADYTYTAPTLRMYDYLSSYRNHCRYMRVHNILTAHGRGDYYLLEHGLNYGNPPGAGKYDRGGDQVVRLNERGELVYDWTTVDKVYDIMLEHGMRPIVETVFMPSCLQLSPERYFLPRDFTLWRKLIEDFVIHLQERYGAAEVEQWYFEIFNEPDQHRFWVEQPETLMALYDYMEAAVHSVNPRIKVGGPAVKQGPDAQKVFRDFLEHCAHGLNYVTGRFGTRVDFLAVHCKGGYPNGNNPSIDVMFDALKAFLEILKEYPEFQDTEFFNDESDIVWYGYFGTSVKSWLNFRNTHYAPGFICKMVDTYCRVVEDEYGANLSIVDSDNCHMQWEKTLFSGNRSQLTPLVEYPSADLIKKPIFNAYVLLGRLGDRRLPAESAAEGFGTKFGVLPTLEGEQLAVMVWNFEDGMDDDVNPRAIRLELKHLAGRGRYKLVHYRIDREHSSSYEVWRAMGKPGAPAADAVRKLREREGLELYEPVRDLELTEDLALDLHLPMHSVSLLLLAPENPLAPARPAVIKGVAERDLNQNRQVFLKWQPNSEPDFLHYRIERRSANETSFRTIGTPPTLNTAVWVDSEVRRGETYFYRVQAFNASLRGSEWSEEFLVRTD